MLFVWLLLGVVQCSVALELRVTQNIAPTVDDVWICTAYKLDMNVTYHLKHFHAILGDPSVHHLGLGTCVDPGSEQEYWNCDDRPGKKILEPGLPNSLSCKDHLFVGLYGRAYGTRDLTMPDDHAYEVGKDTKYRYLVMQVHYVNVTAGKKHDAEIIVQYDERPKQDTSTLMFGVYNDDVNEKFPPHQEKIVEAYREFPVEMHPIFYQGHAHSLSTKVSIYAVKRRSTPDGQDEWIELGKRDPKLPQDYVPVENNVTVVPGDGVAVRCTYYNYRDEPTELGPREMQEMCEISIMCWCKAGDEDKLDDEGVNMNWSWQHDIGLNNIPLDA